MPEELEEKLIPYRQFYNAAEKDFGAFVTIR